MIRLLSVLLFVTMTFLFVASPQAQAAGVVSISQDFTSEFFGPPTPRIRLQQNNTNPGPAFIDSPAQYNLPITQGGALVPLPANPIFNPGNTAMRIVDNVGSQNNSIAFNPSNDGNWSTLVIDFDFLILNDDSSQNGSGADGVAMAYLNTANFGTDTVVPTPVFSEEANITNSFGVGFDTFRNANDPAGPNGETETSRSSVSVHWNGAVIADLDVTGAAIGSIEVGNAMHATIIVTQNDPTSSNVNVVVQNLVDGSAAIVAQDINVPGLVPYQGRIAFNGRTGGANQTAMIDNVSESVDGNVTLFEDFEDQNIGNNLPQIVGGSSFTAHTIVGDGPGIVSQGGDFGVHPAFMRLAKEAQSQAGSIIFDDALPSDSGPIDVNFQIRGLNENTNRADGTSMLLVPTAIHGETGRLPDLQTGVAAEEPDLAGSLGVAFDTFNNDTGGNGELPEPNTPVNVGNNIALHWDGSMVAQFNLELDDLDLVNNEFNDVNIQVEDTGTDLIVTVVITDGTDGSIHLPFVAHVIPGATFGGSDVRLAFAARTGGAFDNYDIDTVNARAGIIPEPTSAMAMLLVSGAFAIRRRRVG